MKQLISISGLKLFIISSVLYFNTYAQDDGLFKQVLYDYGSNQIMKVYERIGNSYEISEGQYKGYPANDHYYTILFDNGDKKILEKNEVVEGNADGNLITTKFDLVSNKTIISSYTINTYDLIFENQLSLDGEQNVKVFNNGTIIISDLWELYGTFISIYDKHLQLLGTIRPFNDGFKNAQFTLSDDKIIAIISKTDLPEETIYFEINPLTGSIILQKPLEKKNFNIVKILSIKNKTIVIEPTKIIAFVNGEVKWEKDVVLPNYDIIINLKQNAIYYCLFDEIVKISADDGKELFSKSFSAFFGISSESKRLMIRPLIFTTIPENNNTLLLLAEANKGVLVNNSIKSNPILFIVDEKGNLMNNTVMNIPGFYWADIVEKRDHKISIITDNQQIEIK